MDTLIIVCIFTGIIHLMETLALSMRLAGVKTKQIATSISFVNISFLIARLSNMFQAPLLGAMVDRAILYNTAEYLLQDFRYIIFAAFIGNLLGAFLSPSMAGVFEEGIYVFEKKGSIPKVIHEALAWRNLRKIFKSLRLPSTSDFKNIKWKAIPHGFLYLNVIMVAIYAVGVLAALLAGAMLPDQRATAVQLSGIVNGMATILLALLVDPTGAHITDQAVRGKRSINDVRTMVFFLIFGRLVATGIVAQLLLHPAVDYIMFFTKIITRYFGG